MRDLPLESVRHRQGPGREPGQRKGLQEYAPPLHLDRRGPNLYLLTVPPTSIKDVNNQLAKIAPYADKVVTLSLEKATNAGGTPYSKVVVKRTGVLPPPPPPL